MLLAFGQNGWVLQRFVGGAWQTPIDSASGAVYDGIAAGRDVVSDVVNVSRPGALEFYVYDDAQDLYVPAEVDVDAGFDGELVSAYPYSDALSDHPVPQPRGPLLAVTRAVESGMYLVGWDGSPPERAFDLGLDARRIRCHDDGTGTGDVLCGVSVFGDDALAIVTWDGESLPTLAGLVDVGDGPVGLDLARLANGNIAVVTTGFNDDTVTETEVTPAGAEVSSQARPAATGCTQPGHAMYLRDAEGLKVMGTCWGSDAFFVEPSRF
ncbi:MAG: hypothetical protein U5J97_03455 [Trueperaceae bacterium]|nr:hypothetical protein [Trueperaceae bacterium]